MSSKLREATLVEKTEIATIVSGSEYEVQDCLDNMAACAIVEDYMTDGPGYHGPVAWVLFTGGPEVSTVLVKDKDGLWEEVGFNT